MKMNKEFFKKNYQKIILFFFASIFLFTTVFFNFIVRKDFVKWFSPDESANYFFSKLYAETGDLIFYEKYNPVVKEIIKPRSFGSNESMVRPVSFLGIILIFGSLAKIISIGIIPYLTPIFAFIGIFFFYLLIKKIFNEKVALLSGILLSFFPVYVYYSARSMFHNVLFIVFSIICFYYSYLMTESRKNNYLNYFFALLAGLFFGLSFITRTSEIFWLFPVFFFLWLFNIKKVGWIKIILFLLASFFAILPIFYWNIILYGREIGGGYPQMNQSIDHILSSSSEIVKQDKENIFLKIKNYSLDLGGTIFHFGFNFDYSIKMFNEYFVKMFVWLFYGSLAGFLIFLLNFKKIKKRHLIYIFSLLLFSTILVFYYGSWIFFDNPDKEFTVGNSYTRYWLPIYLSFIPFLSSLILFLSKIMPKFFQKGFLILVIGVIGLFSYNFLFFGSKEGLYYSYQKQENDKKEFKEVISLTENNSVIITQYHDKLFFPERRVIVGLFTDDNMLREYAKLLKYSPVYYYNFTFDNKTIKYLNERKLKQFNFKINKIKDITTEFTLYKLLEQ
jgi:hypothetical protein